MQQITERKTTMVRLGTLREMIDDSGMTMTAIAQKSGILRETLYNRLDGRGEFKVSEISALCKVLHMSDRERDSIFFND